MRRILIFAGAGLGILLILLIALPFFIPTSVYKAQIERAATDALGRDVTIRGDASLSVFPVISASVQDVSVRNPDGFEEEYMIEAGALRGSVRLWPLFSRRVEVSELAFEDASVRLTRREDGEVNWNIGNQDGSPNEEETSSGDPFAASIDRARLRNANLIYEDLTTGTRYELTDLDAEASLKAPQDPMTLKANGIFQQQSFEFDLTLTSPQTLMAGEAATLDARLGSNIGNLGFDGQLTLQELLKLDGAFTATIPQLSAASEFLDLEMPLELAPLGGLTTSGNVSGTVPNLEFAFERFSLSGDGLNANFDGSVSLAETPSIDGRIDASVRDANAFAQQLGLNIQQLQPIRQVSVDARVEGPVDQLNFSNLDAQTSSPSLRASYEGALSLAGEGTLNGQLSIESEQVQTLLGELGVEMPDTAGIETASLAGTTSGAFSAPSLRNGTFKFDDTTATGNLSADLRGARPSVTAELDIPILDLSPFLGAFGEEEQTATEGWSDEPLDLAALDLLNATIAVRSQRIVIGSVELANADLDARLENGRLTADMERFSAFGGDWQGRAIVHASGNTPSFTFDLSAATVSAQSLLSTLSGFERLSGNGGFSIDVTSSGASVRQIVSALDGSMSLDLNNGALAGVNLGQLVRSAGSLTDALRSGRLSLQSLGGVVSPQAETDFTEFTTRLNVRDGVAEIGSLSLANSVLDVSGTGQINLAGRSLDVRFVPAVDRQGQGNAATVQLNGIPIPLRVQGSWSNPSFRPDFSGVQAALAANARGRAAEEIQERIGGELGSIVSGAISGRSPQSPQSESDNSDAEQTSDAESSEAEQTPADAKEETASEDEASTEEKVVRDVLGRLLGPNN